MLVAERTFAEVEKLLYELWILFRQDNAIELLYGEPLRVHVLVKDLILLLGADNHLVAGEF